MNLRPLTLLIISGIMISCTPKTDSEVSCGTGESFDSVTQSCISGAEEPYNPVALTDSVTILEDSGQNQVFLEYSSKNNTLAYGCAILVISEEINNGSTILPDCSCVGGICSFVIEPIQDFFGISGFTYTISNTYGPSTPLVAQVIVEPVNDPPIADTPSDLKPDPLQNELATSSLAHLVNDIDDIVFTYEIVTYPSKGDLFLNSISGTYTYRSRANLTGADSFTWRAADSHGAWSNVAVVNINIIGVDSPPEGASQTVTTDEDVEIEIELAYFDKDGNLPTACATTEIINLVVTGPCSCTVDGCKVTVKGTPHYFTYYEGSPVDGTVANFNYTISNDFDNTGPNQITVNINEINDVPLALSQSVVGVESVTAFPLPFNFTLIGGVDYDNGDGIPINDQVLSFELLSLPTMGSLTNCLDRPGSEGMDDLTCTFTPVDGNVNGVTDIPAELTRQNIKLVAKWDGVTGESISYQLIDGANMGVEYIKVVGNAITVYIKSGSTTASTIAALINGDLYGQNLVTASVVNVNVGQTSFPTPLNLSMPVTEEDFDLFNIKNNDTVVDSNPPNGAIQINIEPSEDDPVICQYSRFDQAQSCGILGCIGDTTPVGRIEPSKLNLRFFDRSSGVCWVSTGYTSNDWSIGASHIFDQEINEKDVVIVTPTKVDQGGGIYNENNQLLFISNVQSTNHILIPPLNIEFFFNFAQVNPGQFFGVAGQPAANYDFRIKIIPQGGVYGSADVSFDLEDNSGGKTSVQFKVAVNNVSAKHNGWKNLAAIGPKINNFGITLDAKITCSYTQDKCSLPGVTDDLYYKCLGEDDPNGRITTGVKDAIFLNQEDGICWINRDVGTNDKWVAFNTYCNISPPELAQECQTNGSCIFDNAAEINNLRPVLLNNYYYDLETGSCWRSVAVNTNINQVQKYTATNEITLEWNSFTTLGEGSVEGYNVYRRLAGGTFNYYNPINREIIDPDEYIYEDNGTNSIFAPVPKTVYYYDVRPIINEISTDTSEPFKTVRITSPPDNMVFAHRWNMNVRMCQLLHSTNINTLDNFNCPYIAPGEQIGLPPTGLYDIGQDLLVDRFEAGCPYTLAPICSGTPDNACVDLVDPNSTVSGPVGTIFYNRTNATCYRNLDGGVSWAAMDGLNGGQLIGANHRSAQMAPLVNMTQVDADVFCNNSNNIISGILGLNPLTVLPAKLPSRLQQMAYSFYHPDTTDFQISALETGLSLNATPKCNTSRANGLQDDYSETSVPNSSTFYTLPGSLTSDIRSLITGSDQTKLCSSAFGVQDHVGNVGEFTLERITCPSFSTCPGVLSGDALALISPQENYFNVPSDQVDFKYWTMDGIRGPCVDSNADGICDGVIGEWAIQEQNFGAGRMAIPMGLPIQVDFPTIFPQSPANPYLLEIGPTNGITANQLHEDTWAFYNQNIWSTGDKCGSMTAGGNFNDSNRAGQFSFEFLTCGTDATSYLTLGSEMAIRGLNNLPYTLELINPNAATRTISYSRSGNDIVISLATNANSELTSKYTDVANCLNRTTTCNCISCNKVLDAVMFNGITFSNSEVASPMNQTLLIDTTEEAVNNRQDTGFRCLNPIDYDDYIE